MKPQDRIRLFDLAPGNQPDPTNPSCWNEVEPCDWAGFQMANEDGSPAWVADVEKDLDKQGWHLGDEGAGGTWMAVLLKDETN